MRYRALTLSETLIAGAVIGLLLLVIALGVAWVRGELKDRQVHALLVSLDEALAAYHADTGSWPAGRLRTHSQPAAWLGDLEPRLGNRGERELDRDADRTARRVIGELAGLPASRALLEQVPPVLRFGVDPDGQTPETQWDTIRDPWGTPLRCLTEDSASPVDRQAVAANSGCPIFESAGPDRRFGRVDPAAQADNRMLMPSPQ